MAPNTQKAGWAEWPRNVRLFLLFRVFFNARYYYPVFALLFLDLGLTLQQFAVLNALWAVVIVTLEVPSGAMADIFGRLKLLRLASVLMVLEMVCLLLAWYFPQVLVGAIALNRICSGAAEALASGADEALAYDSLAEDQKSQWSRVLELGMRYLNAAMLVAMLVGSAAFDPSLWQRFLARDLAATVATLAPIVLTLGHALIVVIITMLMVEQREEARVRGREAVLAAFRQTRDTLKWLLGQPTVRLVILAAVLFDHLIRQGLVVSSDYLTAIGIPKVYLGALGAVSAAASSLFATPLASLAQKYRPSTLLWGLYGALMITSPGLAHPVKFYSAAWIVALSLLASSVGYLTSLYLNQLADAKRRATLLSVKGLVLNVGYGWISLAYGMWVARLSDTTTTAPVIKAFGMYGPYASVLMLMLLISGRGKPGTKGRPGGYDNEQSPAEETAKPSRIRA